MRGAQVTNDVFFAAVEVDVNVDGADLCSDLKTMQAL